MLSLVSLVGFAPTKVAGATSSGSGSCGSTAGASSRCELSATCLLLGVQLLKAVIFFSLFDRETNPATPLWLPLLWIRRFRLFRRGLVLLELPLTDSGQRYYSR
jgi:hypothetical protein